jgi:hypothetical protein
MRRLIACVIIGLGLLIALNHCRNKKIKSAIKLKKEKLDSLRERWNYNKVVIFFPLPALLINCGKEE